MFCLLWGMNSVCAAKAQEVRWRFGGSEGSFRKGYVNSLPPGLGILRPGLAFYLYWWPIQMGSPACKMCSTGYSLAPHCWMGSIIRKRLLAVEDYQRWRRW